MRKLIAMLTGAAALLLVTPTLSPAAPAVGGATIKLAASAGSSVKKVQYFYRPYYRPYGYYGYYAPYRYYRPYGYYGYYAPYRYYAWPYGYYGYYAPYEYYRPYGCYGPYYCGYNWW